MPNIEIRDSVIKDVRELSKDFREKDRQEAINCGLVPHKALYQCYKQAVYKKTALIDNKVAAMWGVAGTLFGMTGQPYLVTGNSVYEISPIKFAKIYRNEVEIMKTLFPILENYVDASYEGAVRMLEIAGFKLDNPLELGPNKSLFYRFSLGR